MGYGPEVRNLCLHEIRRKELVETSSWTPNFELGSLNFIQKKLME